MDRRLGSLLAIARSISAERNLSALLELLAEEAARLLLAERASIFLFDPESGDLTSTVAHGVAAPIRFPADRGVAGAAFQSGKSIVVDDARRDPRFFAAIDAQTGYRTRNLIAAPLVTGGRAPIGVFEVLNKRRGRFSAEDLNYFEALAAQAAIAIENARLFSALEEERARLTVDNARLIEEVKESYAAKQIWGRSARMVALRELIAQVAPTAVSVLIHGESGTGKELIAKAIHYGSPRATRPLVALNCAALPEALLESELFGIERGTASGVDGRIGRFEQADGGTLFLDEVGELSPAAQAKLLRALQERSIERIGGRRTICLDVRVIAATNRDLEAEIAAKRFRADLYYRLRVVQVQTVPLREIPEEIPLLAQQFLDRACDEHRGSRLRLSTGALARLTQHPWPGNVRELQNEMLRLAIAAPRSVVREEDLFLHAPGKSSPARRQAPGLSLREAITRAERDWILEAWEASGQNQLRTARLLGVSRQGLINKLKRFGAI